MAIAHHTHHEIVCIPRHGFDILHTSGVEAAARVTYHGYTPGAVHDPRTAVRSFWLVPRSERPWYEMPAPRIEIGMYAG